jgi:hypothetical protein
MAALITGHVLLSEEAAALDSNALQAQEDTARWLHGLDDVDPASGSDEENVLKLCLVYQVNYQIERGMEADVYSRLRDGEITSEYRDTALSATASMLADRLRVEEDLSEFQVITSLGH